MDLAYLKENETQFASSSKVLYATDVIYQEASCPCANMLVAGPHSRAKYQFHCCKTEASVLLIGI